MKKLYVGNLSYSTSNESLSAAFGKYKSLRSARIVTDRDSGQARGFGFVEIDDDSEADAAIAEMDGQALDGRNIKVNEARPQTGGGGGGGRGPRSFGGDDRRGGGGRGGFGGGGRSNRF